MRSLKYGMCDFLVTHKYNISKISWLQIPYYFYDFLAVTEKLYIFKYCVCVSQFSAETNIIYKRPHS